ncbi:Anthranilate N-benzoyltransferase protein 2 [Symbiodinium microadriaticum]|uniref:Anthranilate N-benzoyltransferase protein 2 n=1 Tax=Symbiodinium microadriaticum TaxID=2951 RepID=A0A1Q9E841_SYMMI|nr:Anthranilate N-benzoyltransferase protein 2 [Symbiodinium microadriaticum]
MVEASLAKGSSDLRFLLTHHKVTADVQAKLYDNSIDTVAKFAAFVSDATDLREVLKTDLGIDPASSLSLRAQAASLMVAWETAKARVKTQAEAEATNEVREWAKPIPQTDYIAMRQAFATQFGDLEDKHIPAKEYIEKKLHELETGEFRAEPLTEVISRDEVDPDVLLPRWNASGTLSIAKGGSRTTAPSGPEQLRLRLTVLQNALIMIKLKHPGRAELADVTFAVFERYKDYLLGDYCYGLRSSEESGSLIPPWPLILSYEHAIRKHAYKLMATDGRSFGDALARAYKEATVKERHFTTPLALHAKRPSPTVPPPPLNPYQRDPKKGKGKLGKGKDKQPTKFGTLAGTSNRTPDGKPICYRFNAKGGCKKGAKCHFAHVCLHCFAKHPVTECPALKNKRDDKQQETASAWGWDATIECVDICRSAKMDLAKSTLRQSYLDKIQAKSFDAILLSPPCSSFSRAPFANHRGPRPVRCYQHPRGKDTLTARERDRAILGNVFADFAWEVATLVAKGAANFLAFEQPDDLGAIHKGPFAGERPASMWQWPAFEQLLKQGCRTVVFHQASFGTPYAKPTRLFLRTPCELPSFVHEGAPTFDEAGSYLGPLPSSNQYGGLLQHRAKGLFATSGSERWPPRLCQWLASVLVQTCLDPASTATEGEVQEQHNDDDLGYVVNEPEGPRVLGGVGPPRYCQQLGGRKDYHDGGGLCSPGRWKPEDRSLASGPSWDWLREKTLDLVLKELGATDVKELEREAFRMAAGGEHGCSLAKNEKLQSQLRQLWKDWLEAQDLGEEELLHQAEGQPLYLRLLRGLLEAAGDPDREFLRRAEEGLPLGILEQLPRTPHVFEEQLKWPLENAPWEASLAWVPNYSSVEEHLAFAKEKFDEDVEEGLMARMTLREFRERYGENSAIASLAIIVEDELKDKKRIIHDATHGVRVNHRIKCRDKIRAPGAREKKQLLREMIDEKRVAFSVVGDISKAHRRYKHQPSEHGFMGCQLSTEETIPGDPDSQLVYVNLVGTFGLSCASYWWTRIAERLQGDRAFPFSYLFLATLGYPFKWPKTRGGFRVEWLGMETDYPGHQLGLSKKRADWLVEWLRDKATRGRVSAKEFSQGLGRLGFAAMALDWERPFLGPLHAWSSAVQTKVGTLTVPTMLRVLCLWLAERLETGGRLQRPAPLVEEGTPLSCFTDAKAEAGKAWIGGFLELVPGCQGPWFSLEVQQSWAPWAFAKGDPNKVIAALELLATLVAVKLWVPEGPAKKTTRVAIRGYTNNKSNEALLKKAMTTKFPSTLVLMETAEELSAKNCELQLQWIRRDLNQLADDLTNENFASFDPEFRVKLEGQEARSLVALRLRKGDWLAKNARNCELQLQWIRRDLNQLADDLTNENFASFDPEFRVKLEGQEARSLVALRLRKGDWLAKNARPRYHLFGPAVEFANLMESTGVPGKVQISQSTRTWLDEGGHDYDFEHRIAHLDGHEHQTYLVTKSKAKAARQIRTALATRRQEVQAMSSLNSYHSEGGKRVSERAQALGQPQASSAQKAALKIGHSEHSVKSANTTQGTRTTTSTPKAITPKEEEQDADDGFSWFDWLSLLKESRANATGISSEAAACTEEPEIVKLRAGDRMFGMMPLPFATYPAIAMRYSSVDVSKLKRSLGKALTAVPMMAGRLRSTEDGYEVVLNGEGVPFSIVQSSEKVAPDFVEEFRLPDFAIYCRPPAVRAGREPLMTVKLTLFQDGSGILAFCRSHMLLDGSSAWTFLSFWASLARGDTATAPCTSREKMEELIPDESRTQELAQKEIGKQLTNSWFMGLVGILVPVLAPVVDTLFLHTRLGLNRHRVYFSEEELAVIKDEATPTEVQPGQDKWVTTQEAFCAYLLMTLGKHILPADAKGMVQMMFLLDVRKALGLPANQLMGGGLTFTSVLISDLKLRTLPELASQLHECLSKHEGSLEAQKARWQLLNGACEKKMEHTLMQEIHNKTVDMKLAVNNSSKRPLLDFGSGPAESVVSDAGPSLLVPAKGGGLFLYLDPNVFSSAKCSSKEKRSQALEALRADLPQRGTKSFCGALLCSKVRPSKPQDLWRSRTSSPAVAGRQEMPRLHPSPESSESRARFAETVAVVVLQANAESLNAAETHGRNIEAAMLDRDSSNEVRIERLKDQVAGLYKEVQIVRASNESLKVENAQAFERAAHAEEEAHQAKVRATLVETGVLPEKQMQATASTAFVESQDLTIAPLNSGPLAASSAGAQPWSPNRASFVPADGEAGTPRALVKTQSTCNWQGSLHSCDSPCLAPHRMVALELRVSGLTGPLCDLSLCAPCTVQDVKDALQEKLGVPVQEQRLLLGSEEPDASFLLSAGDLDVSLLRCPKLSSESWAQWAETLQEDGMELLFAPEEVQADRELVTLAVRHCGDALALAAEELRSDRDVAMAAVSQAGLALSFVSAALKADKDLVLRAVQQNGLALRHASAALQRDADVALAAVEQNGYVIAEPGFDSALRDDPQVAHAAVSYDGCTLKHVGSDLRKDRQLVLTAVKSNGNAIQWADARFRSDREVMMAAVRYHGTLLRCASEDLRNDRQVVYQAILGHGYALSYASERLRSDPELISLASRPHSHIPIRLEAGKIVYIEDGDERS